MQPTRFIGLDVHKERISVSVAERGLQGAVEYLGEIDNDAGSLAKLCRRLERTGTVLSFCYEAGPCGYGIYRQLIGLGHRCEVVAPSLIPRKPGERVKTDRRNATMLARLHRAGELTAVWVPDAVAYVEELGRIEGVIVRRSGDGFAIDLQVPSHKVHKLGQQRELLNPHTPDSALISGIYAAIQLL